MGRAHRGEAQIIDWRPGEESAFRVDDRGFAGPQGKVISTGHAFRTDQRVHDERAGGERRTFDPNRAECRKFLAARIGGLDRHGPCHGAECLAGRHGAKKTCTLENGERGKTVLALREDSKTGKTYVGKVFGDSELAEIKQRRIINDAAGFAFRDKIDFHRGRKDEPAMQRLDREAGIVWGPDRGPRALPNGHILFVAKVAKHFRDVGRKRFEWLFRQGSGGVGDYVWIERRWFTQGEAPGSLRRGGGCRATCRRGDAGAGGGPAPPPPQDEL